MDTERSYCGHPVTKCAKIIAWIGAVFSILALAGTAYTRPQICVPLFFPVIFYMLTLVGLRKEHPTWILISSIFMLISAGFNIIFFFLSIYAAIVLPENIVKIFQQKKATEDEAKEIARIACFIYAFGSFIAACFTTFAYKIFSNTRKYYLQRGSYIAPSILETA